MASEGNNKINDGFQSYSPSEPALCANGCGFFGTAAMMNFCSKCFRDLRIKDEQASAMEKIIMNQGLNTQKSSSAVAASGVGEAESSSVMAVKVTEEKAVVMSNRCLSCRKKVGVTGFQCRCGSTFCGTHRYPEKHDCTFDFKSQGKETIAQANPVVKADKMDSRI